MSFIEALQKKKSDLKTTSTLVKTVSGDVFLETRDDFGSVSAEKVACSPGYVVDLTPDLQVAKLLPGLYMGSQDAAQDENLLLEHKITHVLSVGVQVCHLLGINYTFVEALDLPEFGMKLVFEQTAELIDTVMESGGAVFVHCNAGVSRSAAIVIAYLMKHEGLRYQQAFNVLRLARPCIKPNEGFVKQLKRLEEDLFCNE